jgi:hypothetical protein
MGSAKPPILLAAVAGALALSGCGLLSAAVGTTSQAALAPVAGVVQEANFGLQTLDHTATTVAGASRTTAASVAQTARTVQNVEAAAPPPVVVTPARPSLTKEQKDAIAKAKDAPQPDIKVLPDETLAQLSKDQLGLQNAAQRAALSAPVGETIFWDKDGRSGTATAKEEHKLGQTLCRTFVQSVTIDGATKEARANACLDSDSGHWQAAF